MGTLANNEDPVVNAVSYQGLHCLLNLRTCRERNASYF